MHPRLLKGLIIGAALSAAGCSGDALPLDRALEQRAQAAIAGAFGGPAPPRFASSWLALHGETNGLVCGRIEAPAAPRGSRRDLRFVYEDRSRHGQVELHEIVSGSGMTPALLEENRTLFERLWSTSCAPGEPHPSLWESAFG
jgi:hypothetical protein